MDITAEKIIAINALETGSPYGMLSYGNAAFIADEINNEPDVFRKAALALYRINTVHPFVDGNERTAFILSQMIDPNARMNMTQGTTRMIFIDEPP